MRRTYRALAFVAALAIAANALTPVVSRGLGSGFLARLFIGSPQNIRSEVLIARLLLEVVTLTASALTTVAMTFAAIIAAQTRRTVWLAALIIVGALAIYAPIVWYLPIVFFTQSALGVAFGFPYGALYGALLIDATPLVTAGVVALAFALTGMRREGRRAVASA